MKKILTFIGLVVIVGGLIAYVGTHKTDPNSGNVAGGATETGSDIYKDGTYFADGAYVSPGGNQKVGLQITLTNDIVTDSVFTNKATDPASTQYESIFAANYKQYVIGKNINSLDLKVVSGSSLTSKGFNAALQIIKDQAKA